MQTSKTSGHADNADAPLNHAAAPVIEVRQVGLTRDGTRILNDISWRVGCGQHWVVIGPNGSGKTTLLRIIAGYLFPSSGSVTVLGCRFGTCNMPAFRKRVGWVSSSLNAMIRPRLQARGVVLSGKRAALGVFEKPSKQEMADAMRALETVDCAHRAELPFSRLSQGEQMRVMIARALIGRPELLVLDEPCVGLDPAAREGVLETLHELIATTTEPPTVLYVTHHTEEMMPAFSHVLALSRGQVMAAGRKREIVTSATISKLFGRAFRVTQQDERFALTPE